ncbi:alpha/beta hydrolase family protein [Streptomyces sp. NBC_01237]|uniref:alpha/beta hydrolase family protein n=1 Tax=Streptomyces sp. NBC_01237 TaxID=2903790 RepID=UPI002DD97935|nr:alpha/beta hydrolase [Streptomyces sp. NBC_01237]WRZ77443.1 alpha/beta hydrolase [Streptomyces sp. NBC_01237]
MTRFSATPTVALLTLALALPTAVAGPAAAAPTPTHVSAAPSASSSVGSSVRSDTAPRTSLPRPTGPYAVGRDTLHLVDRARRDPWVPDRARELRVGMFYPALPGTGTPTPYATVPEARLFLKSYGLEGVFPAETLSATTTSGRVGARPAHGRYPLVVLSPGFGVSGFTLTGLAEELAGRGYVVAAVDHAYESVGTAFPGDRMLTCVACAEVRSEQDKEALTAGRGADVSFLLDRLTGPRPAWRYAGLIDRNRIGMAGHSVGGASAAAAMARDRRIRAGINIDGAFHAAVPADGLGGRPFMMLGTDDGTHRPGGTDTSWDQAWDRLDGWKRWLTVAGATHYSFSDVPLFLDELGLSGTQSPLVLSGSRSLDITRAYVGAFFGMQLKHTPQPLLDGPTPTEPEVTFNNP